MVLVMPKNSSYILKIHTYLWGRNDFMSEIFLPNNLVGENGGHRGTQRGYKWIIVTLRDGYMGAYRPVLSTLVYGKNFP